jgi:hypothetical protein
LEGKKYVAISQMAFPGRAAPYVRSIGGYD